MLKETRDGKGNSQTSGLRTLAQPESFEAFLFPASDVICPIRGRKTSKRFAFYGGIALQLSESDPIGPDMDIMVITTASLLAALLPWQGQIRFLFYHG